MEHAASFEDRFSREATQVYNATMMLQENEKYPVEDARTVQRHAQELMNEIDVIITELLGLGDDGIEKAEQFLISYRPYIENLLIDLNKAIGNIGKETSSESTMEEEEEYYEIEEEYEYEE